MNRYRRISLLTLLMSMALLLSLTGSPDGQVEAQGDGRTFTETGKTVQGKFLQYWDAHGGLAQQGFPISSEMQEKSDTDGKTYTVQYFERAIFELHPENAGTQYEVLLSLLGVFLNNQKYPAGAPNQQPNNDAGSLLFSETGKRVGGKFLNYWNSNGGLAQQGYPISDEFTEVNELDGKSYKVQYFERAVFEMHPENAGTQYEVLLSQLGTFRYRDRYLTSASPTPTAISTAVPLATLTAIPTPGPPTATLPPAPPLSDVDFLGRVEDSSAPFQGPVGLTTDSQDNLYIADSGDYRVLKFDSSGHLVMKFGEKGSGDGQFPFPDIGDVAVDSGGNIYVADSENQRIQKFDSNGHFLAKWGSKGMGDGQFGRALGVAVDSQSTVYAIDDSYTTAFAGRIQKFDSNGHFLDKWVNLQDPTFIYNPGYIATDAQGNVYMADWAYNGVKKFNSSGKVVANWSASHLNYPIGIALDSQGDIFLSSDPDSRQHPAYTTDYYVAKYNQLGQLLAHWGSRGSGDGQFTAASDVAVDSQGNIYVADSINKTIQKFHLR